MVYVFNTIHRIHNMCVYVFNTSNVCLPVGRRLPFARPGGAAKASPGPLSRRASMYNIIYIYIYTKQLITLLLLQHYLYLSFCISLSLYIYIYIYIYIIYSLLSVLSLFDYYILVGR